MRTVIVVVHADQKVGFAAATHLARKGHHVIALGSDPDMLAALRRNVGRVVGLDTLLVFNTHDDVESTIEEINRRTTSSGVDIVIHPRPVRDSELLRALSAVTEPVGGRVVGVGPTPRRRKRRRDANLLSPPAPGRKDAPAMDDAPTMDPELEQTVEPRMRTFGYRTRKRARRPADASA